MYELKNIYMITVISDKLFVGGDDQAWRWELQSGREKYFPFNEKIRTVKCLARCGLETARNESDNDKNILIS